MTNDDRIAALALALDYQRRDGRGGDNIRGLRLSTRDGKPFNAAGFEVASLLYENNGTIHWDKNDEKNGTDVFDNIFEFMAAERFGKNARPRVRMELGQEYESLMRAGVNNLDKWLLDKFGMALYRVTRKVGERGLDTITVHDDYIVDEDRGTTAKQLAYRREQTKVKGQMQSTFKRMNAMEGENVARNTLIRAASEVAAMKPSQPKLTKEKAATNTLAIIDEAGINHVISDSGG